MTTITATVHYTAITEQLIFLCDADRFYNAKTFTGAIEVELSSDDRLDYAFVKIARAVSLAHNFEMKRISMHENVEGKTVPVYVKLDCKSFRPGGRFALIGGGVLDGTLRLNVDINKNMTWLKFLADQRIGERSDFSTPESVQDLLENGYEQLSKPRPLSEKAMSYLKSLEA